MRANSDLTIAGGKVVLVPYMKEHVKQYHAWMQDAALQEATASEPLSLQQEYEMQEDWAADEKKCTFILLDPEFPDSAGAGAHGGAMAGDVNLFWNDLDDPHAAEIEIMVAEPRSRRKGLAREALRLFMAYAATHLGVKLFRAKVGEANAGSRALFHALGYVEVGRSHVFQEVTLELAADGGSERWGELLELGGGLRQGTYAGELEGERGLEGVANSAGSGIRAL